MARLNVTILALLASGFFVSSSNASAQVAPSRLADGMVVISNLPTRGGDEGQQQRAREAMRPLAIAIRRIDASSIASSALLKAIRASDSRSVQQILVRNGFSASEIVRYRIDLNGRDGAIDTGRTISLAAMMMPIRKPGSEGGWWSMVKVGPGVWISRNLLWAWMTGELCGYNIALC